MITTCVPVLHASLSGKVGKNKQIAKVEHTASAFFASLHRLFYGEKPPLPHLYLPLIKNTLATLAAFGYLAAISLMVSGFSKVAFVVVILSTATTVSAWGMPKGRSTEELAHDVEQLRKKNERLHAEVHRLRTGLSKTGEESRASLYQLRCV